MSVDAVDVVVPACVGESVAGGVFPPSDGVFVNVDAGNEWIRGWVVVDRDVDSLPAGLARVAVVPVEVGVPVWLGCVSAGQVRVVDGAERPPGWWDRVALVVVEMLRVRDAHRVAEDAKASLQMSHARWVDKLVEDACTWADENSLCSQFDQFMVDHDLPGRPREFEVFVDVDVPTTTVKVSVTARNADEAREAVCGDDVRSALRDKIADYGSDIDIDDWNVDNVEEP